MTVTFTIPVRIYSEANLREHWRKKAKRVKSQRDAACLLTKQAFGWRMPHGRWAFTLIRIAPRELDTDNLARSMKAIRDGIADALNIDDGDSQHLWVCDQEQGIPKVHQVRVEIERRGDEG